MSIQGGVAPEGGIRPDFPDPGTVRFGGSVFAVLSRLCKKPAGLRRQEAVGEMTLAL